MQLSWWKYLGILLIVYALVVGMLVPLKPGLLSIDENSFTGGQPITLTLSGYGTHFLEKIDSTRAWMKLDDGHVLPATNIDPQSDTEVQITFDLMGALPGDKSIVNASLIVDHVVDKSMVLPGALFIKRNGEKQNGLTTPTSSPWTLDRPEGLSALQGFYFPYRNILVETIRNIFYHVSLWFAMFLLLLLSVFKSIMYLKTKKLTYDAESDALVRVGVLFGLLGLTTGALWAKYTWGTWWTTDVKLNMAAVSMLIYLGYLLLRSSISDRERCATVSASYSIFAYFAMIPLLFIVPRMTDSLHPGNGGNPALGGEDLDNTMRMVFYPAIIGFTLVGLWMAQIKWRIEKVFLKKLGL